MRKAISLIRSQIVITIVIIFAIKTVKVVAITECKSYNFKNHMKVLSYIN